MSERGNNSEGKIEGKIEGKRPLVIIGTSGSTDYLRDTGDRRYWPVGPSSVDASPLSPKDRAVVQCLVELTGGTGVMWIGKAGESCDGLHDECAPANYQCSRCSRYFPEGQGDLVEPQDDEFEEAC